MFMDPHPLQNASTASITSDNQKLTPALHQQDSQFKRSSNVQGWSSELKPVRLHFAQKLRVRLSRISSSYRRRSLLVSPFDCMRL